MCVLCTLAPPVLTETDPLILWWTGEKGHFPTLAKLAQKYLCVCGTSVPSERIFSKTGCINDNFWSCMNVDKLLFFSLLCAKNILFIMRIILMIINLVIK